MSKSQWHRFYQSTVAAPRELLFHLIADMPNYPRWLPPSGQYTQTTAVEPYPVRLGSRYHDGQPRDGQSHEGQPDQPGKDWWGTVVGFDPPGSIDFHHTIHVPPLRATIDTHIHYSFEPAGQGTAVSRWLVLDFAMPLAVQPLRPVITSRFDQENKRTMAALRQYAEAHADEVVPD
jgi:hypothetical protein